MALVPGLEDPSYVSLYGAVAAAFVAVASVLVVATKGRLGYRAEARPRDAPARS